MRTLTIVAGTDRAGMPEEYGRIELSCGQLYAVVGNTGSGKSRLIKDIEQLVQGESVSHRLILLDGEAMDASQRRSLEHHLIAHLSQSMRFVLDASVTEFIELHAASRDSSIAPQEVIALANDVTPEHIDGVMGLGELSGGQARALMIADVALVCDSPIVLVDEIENAGIDKRMALQILCGTNKLVLVATHDPHTALMAPQRLVMKGGGIRAVIDRTPGETILFDELSTAYEENMRLQARIREGEVVA